MLPPDPSVEPQSILIDRGEWVDEARDGRKIPYKIYRPEKLGQDHPVIVWSHGLGGTRDGAGFIARYLASHGFIHVNIQHDGTDDCLWRGMSGHPWDNIRKAHIGWDTIRNRYLDVPFAVDCLEAMNNTDSRLAGAFDFTRMGISGHSLGALTTQVIAGELAGMDGNLEDLSDHRFKAGILYSPTPELRFQSSEDGTFYSTMRLPLLHITGTNDSSPVEGFGYERRLEVYDGAGAGDQYLVILDNGDHMVFNGSRGQLETYAEVDQHQDMIKQLALVWWRAWLLGDNDARAFLDGHAILDWLEGKAAYRHR